MKHKNIITLGIIGVFVVGFMIYNSSTASLGVAKSSKVKQTSDVRQLVFDEPAPDATFTTLQGETMTLSELSGEKVMFWFFATWCSSCTAGAKAISAQNWQLNNLKIVAMETYGNAGYAGPSVEEFALANVPEMFTAGNWIWGEASREATQLYNPKNYPDIYFLVDENGILRAVDGAPAATINKIVNFANE